MAKAIEGARRYFAENSAREEISTAVDRRGGGVPGFVRAEATLGERFVRCRSMESQYKHGGCVEETCNTSFCLNCLLHRESRLELHCRSAGRGGAAVAGLVRPMLTFPDKFHHAPPVPTHLPPPTHRTIHRDSAKLRLVER